MKTLLTTSAAMALACVALPAAAQTAYGQLNLGSSVSGSSNARLDSLIDGESFTSEDDVELDSGFVVSGGLGVDFNNGFRLEGELLGSSNDIESTELGGDEAFGLNDVTIRQVSGFANLLYDFQNSSAWTPYLGAGVGYGATQIDVDFDAGTGQADEENAGFAWQLRAGVSYDVSETLSIDAGYRYIRQADFEVREDLVGPDSYALNIETDIHALTIGARFRFGQ